MSGVNSSQVQGPKVFVVGPSGFVADVDSSGRLLTTGSGGGGGTVSSVTFTGDGVSTSVTPSAPVTTTGTLTAVPATQTGNVFIASPANGSSGLLSARAITPADLAGVGIVSAPSYATLPWGTGGFASPSAVGVMDGTANRCRFVLFTVTATIKITKLSAFVTTSANTQNIFVGIYNSANTTLLGQWSIPLTASTGVYSVTKVGGGSLTLAPGTYMLVWASDSATPVLSGYNVTGGSTVVPLLLNKNVTRMGQGATGSPAVSGVLPANLGVLVAANVNVPGFFVEP